MNACFSINYLQALQLFQSLSSPGKIVNHCYKVRVIFQDIEHQLQ